MMEDVLDENGVWEYTQINIPKPATSDAQALAEWKKYIARSRRIILKGVKNYVVSNLHGKETPFGMWKILTYVFLSSSDVR